MAGAKQFDPARALQDAMAVFRSHGYAATSMQDLEAATGLGRGSIYNAFGDKHSLFIATLERYCEQRNAELAAMVRDAPRAVDGVRLAIRTAAVYSCMEDGRDGCLIGNAALELANRDAAVATVVHGAFERMAELFRDALLRAQADGDFGRGRDPEATARFLVLGIQGIAMMAKTSPDPKLVRGVAEEIVRVVD